MGQFLERIRAERLIAEGEEEGQGCENGEVKNGEAKKDTVLDGKKADLGKILFS
jgi:hypothetical protein